MSAETLAWAAGAAIVAAAAAAWIASRRTARRQATDARSAEREADELRARVEALREGRRTLETILSSMEEGVVLIDPRGRVAFTNRAAARMLGPPASSLRELVPTSLQNLIARSSTSGEPQEVELETGVPARALRAAALPLDDGGTLLVVRDVTAAKRVEAMRRDFVADASHELKTPAASIRAAAETVERSVRDDPEAAARFASGLARDAERLSRIVSDLLDLSRLESERPSFERVDLESIVVEEATRARAEAERSQVRLEVDPAPVAVSGSRRDLGLLVRNLLENAVRSTAPGGSVRVRSSRSDGAATIEVADTGIGIPTRDLPRIFERFYRVDRARSRETGGTGLGLSIARHVTEQHGGEISAESELGRGSTFRVTLPVAPR